GARGTLGFRDTDVHEPVDRGDVMLPATPHDGIALAHQEPIPGIERRTRGDRSWSVIEHPQCQSVSSVRHVEQKAIIAALRVNRPKDADIRCKTYQAVVVTRGEAEVRNAPVERGGRINRKMCDSIELFIRTNGTKSAPTSQCTSRCELTGYDCHRKSPWMDLLHYSRTLFSPARLSSLLDGIDAKRPR